MRLLTPDARPLLQTGVRASALSHLNSAAAQQPSSPDHAQNSLPPSAPPPRTHPPSMRRFMASVSSMLCMRTSAEVGTSVMITFMPGMTTSLLLRSVCGRQGRARVGGRVWLLG